MTPAKHSSWPRLGDDQRQAINELWDELVIPALEQVDEARRERDDARLEAQDARSYAAHVQVHAETRARDERERRRALHAEVARLRQRVLELECPEMAA